MLHALQPGLLDHCLVAHRSAEPGHQKLLAAIGKRLRALGRLHQVFCITHLPQVASQAQHHLVVEKSAVKDRTVTTVRALSAVQRESEIARMLGGETITKKVLATAAELIAEAKD